MSYVVVSFYVKLMELTFHHVVIDKIVDHHCFSFLFTLYLHNRKRKSKRQSLLDNLETLGQYWEKTQEKDTFCLLYIYITVRENRRGDNDWAI